MISTRLYLYKCLLSDIGISFKEEGGKLTYLSNYLNKMKQKIKQFENTITQKKSDQITVEVVYL
jgi:hypothetical protein